MAAVPIATNDSAFYTNVGTDLVVTTSSSPAHLLANDLDIDGGSMTSGVVANPTSGTIIAFGTNGTFTYRPNSGFVGVDSFTYKVNDGSLDSNVATVLIAVGTNLLARQNLESNLNSSTGDGLLTSGGLQLVEQLTPDQSLVYRSDSLVKPIITVETQLAPGTGTPSAVTAQLTFNGASGTTYLHADGDSNYSTLVKNTDNSFTLTAKTGGKSNFSSTGLLTSLVDTNSNTTSFAYADRNSDDIAKELISIADPFGRVTNVIMFAATRRPLPTSWGTSPPQLMTTNSGQLAKLIPIQTGRVLSPVRFLA